MKICSKKEDYLKEKLKKKKNMEKKSHMTKFLKERCGN